MVAQLRCSVAATIAATLAISPVSAKDDYPDLVAQEGKQLQPLSPWALDYGVNTCRLARTFGSEDDRHLLFIDQTSPGNTFAITVAGSSLRNFRRGNRANLGLQSDVPMQRFEVPPTGEMEGYGSALILTSIRIDSGSAAPSDRLRIEFSGEESESEVRPVTSASLDLTEAAKIERVVLKRGGRVFSLETGSLLAPFEALNSCTAELLLKWGLDPEEHRSFSPVVWENRDDVVNRIVKRYPRAALNRGKQANFSMRVIIDEAGAVAECKVTATTTAENFESPVCEEMAAARFAPALDTDGQPMRSFYATTIRYQIRQ